MPVTIIQEGQQATPSGDFEDVYQISYTVPGNPAPLTVNVAKTPEALQDAIAQINALTTFVTELKALP